MDCAPCEARAREVRIRGLGEALVRSLGEAPSGAPSAFPDLGRHALALGGVAAGGAVVGGLVGVIFRRPGLGAAVGALAHLALFGLGGAVFGGLSTRIRLAYGAVGLAAGSMTGYLLLRRSS